MNDIDKLLGGILNESNGKGSLTRLMLLISTIVASIAVLAIVTVWVVLSLKNNAMVDMSNGLIASLVIPFVLKLGSKYLENKNENKKAKGTSDE